ncbi:hypothetical protein HUO14_00030 [Parasphingorhabdus flavimaris]|jgi:hypothetical protein|uniref:DUF4402 domain-containing protein n=1 Tax=Parasphingorhabdus flavimaris TaxID=266812 RepID=A0ABX2MXV2_9SPHN|nr:hypothetical protein [Parasphingorhabdus flavimaris]NVD26284.1 hypothetical protein [Parasphingorhabdus flavimaris]|tara:strand:+ start:4432 stop:4863 length:432 start_codon:yes stop_codon:yes gene_type:complete
MLKSPLIKPIAIAVAMISGSFLALPAHAAPNDTGGFSVAVTVPVICDLEATDFIIDQTTNIITGQVQEYCNSSRGFHVLANHRPLLSGEQVDLTYGGVASQLATNGFSSVAFRAGARFGYVPITIHANNVEGPIALSFAVTAL